MRIFALLTLFFLVFGAFSTPARAGFWDDFKCWFIVCEGGDEEYTRPELEDGKAPHNTEFADDPWTPQEWINAKGSATAVVDGFYKAGIVTDQSSEGNWSGGAPVIEVGQGFMRLSGRDKRRVIKFMDETFKMTDTSPAHTILIRHKASGDSIGVYTLEGLQLQ